MKVLIILLFISFLNFTIAEDCIPVGQECPDGNWCVCCGTYNTCEQIWKNGKIVDKTYICKAGSKPNSQLYLSKNVQRVPYWSYNKMTGSNNN